MLLSELFDRLALGELGHHKYGKTGAIQAADQPALIHQLNSGLTKLYAHFPLSEKELVIQQDTEITEYKLHSDFAASNTGSTEPVKYIIDSEANPFTDDILRIEAAYDGEGNQIPLNDSNRTDSWFTPSWSKLQIPSPLSPNTAILIYRAKHPAITTDAALTTVVDIPVCLEEALQAYIASRCFVSLGNQSSGALASFYSNRYQEQLAYVEANNLLPTKSVDSNLKLSQKGFL